MMNKTSKLSLVIALEIIALEIGAYTYAALLFHDRRHVLLLTGLLCLFAGIIGAAVTRAKAQAASWAILVLGLIALGIGLYFRLHLHYHERAAAGLGIGVLGLLGGLAGIIIPRSREVALGGMLVIGLVTLSFGLYSLTVLGYHGRAYMVLGTGTLCLLASVAGFILIQYRAYTAR